MVKNSIKKVQNWMFAAILAILCGCSTFTACTGNDDRSATEETLGSSKNPAGQTDVSVISDKVWAYSQTHPDGFTLDIRTMTEPTARFGNCTRNTD